MIPPKQKPGSGGQKVKEELRALVVELTDQEVNETLRFWKMQIMLHDSYALYKRDPRED